MAEIFEVKDNRVYFKNWLLFNFLLTTEIKLSLQPWISQSIFIKFTNQGRFWSMLVMRIPKLTLIFEFDAALTEIFQLNFQSVTKKLKSSQFLKCYQLSLTSIISAKTLIKLNMQGMFQNPHDQQISKLSLGFKFDEDFT